MLCKVYPRVGGGTIILSTTRNAGTGLSPRGRGTAVRQYETVPPLGPNPRGRGNLVFEVYPRAGEPKDKTYIFYGLSPRGRGNPVLAALIPSRRGSIPAWAGEPASYSKQSYLLPVYPRVGGGTVAEAHVHRVI